VCKTKLLLNHSFYCALLHSFVCFWRILRGYSKPERTGAPFLGLEIQAWGVPAAKLLDFTAGTYVSEPSKLATFTIAIRQLISQSNFTFLQS